MPKLREPIDFNGKLLCLKYLVPFCKYYIYSKLKEIAPNGGQYEHFRVEPLSRREVDVQESRKELTKVFSFLKSSGKSTESI